MRILSCLVILVVGATVQGRVAVAHAQTAPFSCPWTDFPIVAGQTPIKAEHINEIRACLDVIIRNWPQSGGSNVPFSTEDLTVGAGQEAMNGDTLSVNYTGWLYDPNAAENKGAQFDSGDFSFVLGSGHVIAGWNQGLLGMRVGGQRRIVIPPELGYGANGSPPTIPGDATLLFEVELLRISGDQPAGSALTGTWNGRLEGAFFISGEGWAMLIQDGVTVTGHWSMRMPAALVALGAPPSVDLAGPVTGTSTGTTAELSFGFLEAFAAYFGSTECAIQVSVTSYNETTMEAIWATNASCQPPINDEGTLTFMRLAR